MAEEEQDVEAGSETSGEEAAETSQEETAAEPTDAPEEKSEEAPADAAGAAETPTSEPEQVPVDGSRTGFVESGRPGGECICPDGRKGTIHSFDAGLVCIPNDNQGN
jgi:hypothetical protein